MSLTLHDIKPKKGSRKTSKRLGRGLGSGKGTYSGRGVKGQKARSGSSGLQLRGIRAIMLSIPKKRGFESDKPRPAVVNLRDLNKAFKDGERVNPKALVKKGLIEAVPPAGVKILGDGALAIKLSVQGCKLSKSAKEKVEQAGGSVS